VPAICGLRWCGAGGAVCVLRMGDVMIGMMRGVWISGIIEMMSGLPLMDTVYQEVQFKDKRVMMDVEKPNELGMLWSKLRRTL